MSGEAEPRRSVRATKGQHTKSFDELETNAAPKRRQTKKTKKAREQEATPDQEQSQEETGQDQDQDQDQEQDDDQEVEIIRCICGATEQDEDSGEAWIACETCGAWQHNVCVGVSSYDDEIPEHYWCEQCRPQNHKELLEGIAKGEKPWEARRKAHEEESEKKKKRGGRRGKGKRNSDTKDETDKSKAKPSPAPDGAAKDKKEAASKPTKRKSRDDSHDPDGKTPKLRRVSENEAVPVQATYTSPPDIAKSISDLSGPRVGPAKALLKSISHVLTTMQKNGDFELDEGSTVESMAETFALQIERSVFDTHPMTKGQKEYNQQIKTLSFNLKNNPELCHGLVSGTMLPTTLAVMTSEQLASSEMQRQTAEMKAKAEKQSILYTSETGPRVRRTHKGEEVVEDDSFVNSDVPPPLPPGPRRAASQTVKNEPSAGDETNLASLADRTQHSPSNPNFDITKVFSSVKSPTNAQPRRSSGPAGHASGPGVDPDVDRMLQEDNDSPPYSPTEETQDPDVIWRGSLAMSSIADFPAVAKHVGGANFSAIGPWSKLMPKRMTVAGRITQQSAIEYLCSLRYSSMTDIIVVSLAPVAPAAHAEFNALIDYFVSKKRYGVVGDKVVGNVRDTYLVPVPAGEGNYPEFMLNLLDNKIPKTRTEPMLLAVFVYRNDPENLKPVKDPQQEMSPTTQTPRSNSMSTTGPAFSPATPQAPQPPHTPQAAAASAFSGPQPAHLQMQSTTPVPIVQPPHAKPTAPVLGAAAARAAAPNPGQNQTQPQAQTLGHAHTPAHMSDAQKFQAQQAGQAIAHEVLGQLISAPTVQFLLPQAFQMSRREWEVVKGIFERDTRAKDDLQHLGALLEKSNAEKRAEARS